MVIVRVCAGLGNQMFQYALGRQVATANGTDLLLDITDFQRKRARPYWLEHLNVQAEYADNELCYALSGAKRPDVLGRVKSVFTSPVATDGWRVFKQKQFEFDPEVLELSGDVYLDGFWQSGLYFEGIEPLIRAEITLRNPLNPKRMQLAEEIDDSESICLHVRRGDYVSKRNFDRHGVCELSYYKAGIEHIVSRVPKPKFFVFSDTPEWARENLRTGFETHYIEPVGDGKDYEDMMVMSRCKHFIIANSTFSWWAAWLASNEDKCVVAPKNWFRTTEYDPRDLFLPDWVTL